MNPSEPEFDFAAYYRRRGQSSSRGWVELLVECLNEIFEAKRWNRVKTVATAVKTVIEVACNFDPSSAASKKLVTAARTNQIADMTASGHGVVHETLIMRRFWIAVMERME